MASISKFRDVSENIGSIKIYNCLIILDNLSFLSFLRDFVKMGAKTSANISVAYVIQKAIEKVPLTH